MDARALAPLVALAWAGCLIAETPDGNWSALTEPCFTLAATAVPITQHERYVNDFAIAGDTLLFDTPDGIAQVSLRDGDRSTVVAAFDSGVAYAEFYVVDNDLVYYAATTRDLVADRGADVVPRWLTITSRNDEEYTRILATPTGVFWRGDGFASTWRQWRRSTGEIATSALGNSPAVATDGTVFFFKSTDDVLFTLAVAGGTPSMVAPTSFSTLPIGVADSQLVTLTGTKVEAVSPTGTRLIAEISETGTPARHAFGGGYFYWAPNDGGPDEILRVPLAGGPIETFMTLDSNTFRMMKADACNLYWQTVQPGGVDISARSH